MSLIPSGELKVPGCFKALPAMLASINESNSLRGVERYKLRRSFPFRIPVRINESNSLRGVESPNGIFVVNRGTGVSMSLIPSGELKGLMVNQGLAGVGVYQ